MKSICTLFTFTLLLFTLFISKGQAQCPTPENVSLSNKEANQVTMRWNPVPEAIEFQVVYKANSEPDFQTITVPKGVYLTGISGLLPSTDYTACITAACSGIDTILYSKEVCIQFRTCEEQKTPPVISGIVEGQTFCIADTNHYQLSATPSGGIFTGAGVINNSFQPSLAIEGENFIFYTINNQGCVSFASIKVNIQPQTPSTVKGITDGQKFCLKDNTPVSLVAVPSGGDFLLDGVPIGTTIVPNTLKLGKFLLKYRPPAESCGLESVIQFSVVDNDPMCTGVGPCDSPTNIAGQLSNSRKEALITWKAVTGMGQYQVAYRIKNSNLPWTMRMVRSNLIAIQNLNPSGEYEARIRTVCNKMKTSNWSDTISLGASNNNCLTPIFSYANNITRNSAIINWSASNEASKYYILVRQDNGSEVVFSATGTTLNLRGLKPDTKYSYRIRTKCSDGKLTLPLPAQTFTTTK